MISRKQSANRAQKIAIVAALNGSLETLATDLAQFPGIDRAAEQRDLRERDPGTQGALWLWLRARMLC